MRLIDSVVSWFKGSDDGGVRKSNPNADQTGISTVDSADLQSAGDNSELSQKQVKEHLDAQAAKVRISSPDSFLSELAQKGGNEKVLADTLKEVLSLTSLEDYDKTVTHILETTAGLVNQDVSTASPGVLLAKTFLACEDKTYNTENSNAVGKVFLSSIEKVGTPNEKLAARTSLAAIKENPSFYEGTVLMVLKEAAGKIAEGTDNRNSVQILSELGFSNLMNCRNTPDQMPVGRYFLDRVNDLGGPEDKILYSCCTGALNKHMDNPYASGPNVLGPVFELFARGTAGVAPGDLLIEAGQKGSKNAYDTNDKCEIASAYLTGIASFGTLTQKHLASAAADLLGAEFCDYTRDKIIYATFSGFDEGTKNMSAGRILAQLAKTCMDNCQSFHEQFKAAETVMNTLANVGTPVEKAYAGIAADLLSQKYNNSPIPALRTMFVFLADEQFRFAGNQMTSLLDECTRTQAAWFEPDGKIVQDCMQQGIKRVNSLMDTSDLRRMAEAAKAERDAGGESPVVTHDHAEVNIDGATLKKRKATFSLLQGLSDR